MEFIFKNYENYENYENDINKLFKKQKIKHTLSLTHPDLLNSFIHPDLLLNHHLLKNNIKQSIQISNNLNYLLNSTKLQIKYITYIDFIELLRNLKQNNFNLNNKALNIYYDKFLKDIIIDNEQSNYYEEDYIDKLIEKKWQIDELLYHIYLHDSNIVNIYPDYFNKSYMNDLKLNAKEILFKYYAS